MIAEFKRASVPEMLLAGLLPLSMVAGGLYLIQFWRDSAELSHGFFALPLSLWLLWLSRDEPQLGTAMRRAVGLASAGAFLLVAPIAGMAALAQGIGHSQTAFLATVAFALFLAGSVAALGGGAAIVRFNGAGLCAGALWLFAGPLPSGVLSRLTVWLQDKVTGSSLFTLRLLGIPAMRHGNVLELSTQMVGVEEACSGIRSLIACLFAGVFLGGLMLRGVWPRVGLVFMAGLLALVGNFVRSVTLCLLVSQSVSIDGWWHDATAYAVLGVTVVALYFGCTALTKGEEPSRGRPDPTKDSGAAPVIRQLGLAALAVCIVAFVSWRSLPGSSENRRLTPDLRALLTIDAPEWAHASNPQILRFAKALNTQILHEVTYVRGDTQVTFYMAYWPAGQSNLGSVGLHTPDMCLPGAGWTRQPTPPAMDHYPLPATRRFSFIKDGYPQNVWFWHFFGGHAVEPLPGLYPWQLAPYILKRPVSSSAAQWVLRVSSNKPLEDLAEDPLLRRFFRQLRDAGLVGKESS